MNFARSRFTRATVMATMLTLAPVLAHAEGPVVEKEMHSPGLLAGGVVLTTIGVISAALATYVFIVDSRGGGDFRGLASVVIGLPLTANALGCLGGGIPMIVIGAKPVYRNDGSAATSAMATATWTF